MISFFIRFYSLYKDRKAKRAFLSSSTIGSNPEILNGSMIRLMCDSSKTDISIGDNFRSFGAKLISQSHGKIIIGNNVKLGFNVVMGAVNSIKIGDGTALADNITIMDNNNHSIHPLDRKFMYSTPPDSEFRRWRYSQNAPIDIGRNVWIGSDVRICKGVTIGDNCVVAACTVVTKDVPENCVVAGNPGKIVKRDIDKEPRIFVDI